LNFDLDKIEWKVPPPWLKPQDATRLKPQDSKHRQHHIFTGEVCQQSVRMSESKMSEYEESIGSRKGVAKGRRSMLEELRLDRGVEEKLKKIIKK
jgi:hypothetical protein